MHNCSDTKASKSFTHMYKVSNEEPEVCAEPQEEEHPLGALIHQDAGHPTLLFLNLIGWLVVISDVIGQCIYSSLHFGLVHKV